MRVLKQKESMIRWQPKLVYDLGSWSGKNLYRVELFKRGMKVLPSWKYKKTN